MLNMLLIINLTTFDKITRENVLISSTNMKSLLLPWVDGCKCTFMQLVLEKILYENGSFVTFHSSKTILPFLRKLRWSTFFFFPTQAKTSDLFVCEIFFLILSTIKGELRLWWKSKEHQQIWALLSFWIAFLLLSSFKWFSMAGTFFLISHS